MKISIHKNPSSLYYSENSLLRCLLLGFLFSLVLLVVSCSGGKKATSSSSTKEKNDENLGSAHKESTKKIKKKSEQYAEKLGIEPYEDANLLLLETSAEWLGVPYKYGGNTKKGTDCSGFAQYVYKTVYEKDLYRSCEDIYKQSKSIKQKDLEEGDLVFFKIDGNKISHIGIYLHDNKFIHASTKKGVLVNDLDEPYYKKCYFASGRAK